MRSGNFPRNEGERSLLSKAPTGIDGLDQITSGGLPRDRLTLIAGGPGCGKTVLALEFLVNGAIMYDEPGVFISFEESAKELIQNSSSIGFNLDQLVEERKLHIENVEIGAQDIVETGEYDLEGLFIRLNYAIESIGARRMVLDTIETIFSSFSDQYLLRSELSRLFRWLKGKNLATIVTGEQGEKSLTRNGLEEYVSDCVIFLDQRVYEQISTRRLRIIKYRGSTHGTNEYPFIIKEEGISVLPITSVSLEGEVSNERVSTGLASLDEMMGGIGYYRGSTVMISGGVGTGKTSLASSFALATCKSGESVLYLSLEEASKQIIRNMASIGIDFEPMIRNGLLRIVSQRPTFQGIESYLVDINQIVDEFKPQALIVDPVSALLSVVSPKDTRSMIVRMLDSMKTNGVTTILTELLSREDQDRLMISSLADTIIVLSTAEKNAEMMKTLRIVKSRGMGHSNQISEVLMDGSGIRLLRGGRLLD